MFSVFITPSWLPTRQNIRLRKNLAILRDYIHPKLFTVSQQQTMFADIVRAHTDQEGRLDKRRALEETISNLVGGSETTIILLTWVLYYIVQNPDVEEKILNEIRSMLGGRRPTLQALKNMPYLDAVVQETLRLRSPAYVQCRTAVVDTDLDGFKVDKGTIIFACQYITHLDPRVWRNPAQFDPERFIAGGEQTISGTAFFPFGGGKRICVGMNYAVNEAKLVAILLLRSFRFSAKDARALADVGVDARTTARPDRPVELRVTLREDLVDAETRT